MSSTYTILHTHDLGQRKNPDAKNLISRIKKARTRLKKAEELVDARATIANAAEGSSVGRREAINNRLDSAIKNRDRKKRRLKKLNQKGSITRGIGRSTEDKGFKNFPYGAGGEVKK